MASNKISGWLRQRMRADGMTWLWCYQRLRPGDGKMVENSFQPKPRSCAVRALGKFSNRDLQRCSTVSGTWILARVTIESGTVEPLSQLITGDLVLASNC